MHVLLDGDLLVFSICAAIEYRYKDIALEQDWEDDDWLEFLPAILKSVDSKINFLVDRLAGTKYTVFFSCSNPENFRTTVMPEYKANRANVWRPNNLKIAIAETARVHNSVKVLGMEADDMLAHYQKTDGSTCIVTLDKDLLQCRGALYRWETQHEGEKFFSVTGQGHLRMDIKCKECDTTTAATRDNYLTARKVCEYCNADLRTSKTKAGKANSKQEVKGDGPMWFLYQCLIGDSTDGIMGAGILTEQKYRTGAKAGQVYSKRKGVGSIQAFEILSPFLTYSSGLQAVKKVYVEMHGGRWTEELLKQGRCLYMVKNILPNGLQHMWHYDPSVKEYFDAEQQKLVWLEDE